MPRQSCRPLPESCVLFCSSLAHCFFWPVAQLLVHSTIKTHRQPRARPSTWLVARLVIRPMDKAWKASRRPWQEPDGRVNPRSAWPGLSCTACAGPSPWRIKNTTWKCLPWGFLMIRTSPQFCPISRLHGASHHARLLRKLSAKYEPRLENVLTHGLLRNY